MSAQYDLTINQGETLDAENFLFTWKAGGLPVNLTGYSARAQCRDGGKLVFDWSTENGKIVLGGANGTIAPSVAATETATYAGSQPSIMVAGRQAVSIGQWDLELESPAGRVTRLLQGVVHLVPEATK